MTNEEFMSSSLTPCYGALNEDLKNMQQQNVVPNAHKPQISSYQLPHFIQSKAVIELQIADLRRQQLILEKQHLDEVFRAKQSALEAETNLALIELDVNPASVGILPDINNKSYNDVPEVSDVFANASAPPAIETVPVLPTISTQNVKALELPVKSVVDTSGLSLLSSLDRVKILLTTAPSLNETYEVFGPDGSAILRINLSVGFLSNDSKRTFQGEIFDNKLQEVATFNINDSSALELLVGNKKVCVVKRQRTFIKPVLTISNVHGNVILKIKGQGFGCNLPFFTIETADKERVGCIIKDLSSSTQASNTPAESVFSAIDLPSDLDVHCKAAIIASSFLIVSTEHSATRQRLLRKEILGGSDKKVEIA